MRRILPALTLGLLATVGAWAQIGASGGGFTIAVIPDTQNYVDYKHQTEKGFKFDARDLLFQQFAYLAENAAGAGSDIAFVTHVGDVWQHQTSVMDPAHAVRGFTSISNPWLAAELEVTPLAKAVEMPAAKAAFGIISGKLPFSVVPGNHDYDAMWSDSRWPPITDARKLTSLTRETLGALHAGGLDNFKGVFTNATGGFFADKPWYVASYNDGADSAQTFSAGGHTFLHLGLEMSPSDEVLDWAHSVLRANPGLPTIVTTHDYLNTDGSRTSNPIIDMKSVDPEHNSPQNLWDKFISKNDQIFLVLCGHEHGQAYREDLNDAGHKVYQILADYQDRGQVSVDLGVPLGKGIGGQVPVGIGDGWIRLMQFSLGGSLPLIHVRTYSTFYKAFSTEITAYASWYRPSEAPTMTDAQYLAKDDFFITMSDFRARFGK